MTFNMWIYHKRYNRSTSDCCIGCKTKHKESFKTLLFHSISYLEFLKTDGFPFNPLS